MDFMLKAEFDMLIEMGAKPNFSDIARRHDMDRRTVKKYFEGYEKPEHRDKPSRLDKYYELIMEYSKEGETKKKTYEYISSVASEAGDEIGSYSNFARYLNNKIAKESKEENDK